ncbi:phosphate transporter [Cristinia sonorae]|uniref:Phosphate transporter n=1 Tax=Cristinia sonorae TaxID=1940300 RepID=A0A8K0UGA4_9AGAR|nr:phosphate transporter [Cristinia sonorae]
MAMAEARENTPSQASGLTRRPHSDLGDFERTETGRPTWLLTIPELKLLGIAGIGFFLDAYDLFVINPVATMLQYRLYGGNPLPPGLEGFVKAGANIGSVIGQFVFGFAADYYGRKAVYGKELMLIIFATIMTLTTPTGALSPESSLIYLAVFRIILGIGVGGDYPMSASVSTDRANLKRRGTMLSYIFANQGWGSLVGSLVFIVTLACYRHVMDVDGQTSKVDGVWRIVVGVSLVPAFGTLYQRLTLPEAKRFEDSRDQNGRNLHAEDSLETLKAKNAATDSEKSVDTSPKPEGEETANNTHNLVVEKKNHFAEFIRYFSEWRHAKQLIGTCACWFLLDIAFYGINLNQNVVLEEIGFDGKDGTPWNKLFKIGIGSIIITGLGFVPGYYVTVITIEKLGRKWIQLQGFLMAALFLGILAGKFNSLNGPAFIVCFAFLQFFFNFGANTTTYCYPAELFPTKFRAAAHGISAASGKAGAIISALAFNSLSKKIGTPAVLWIFFGCCIAGAVFTLLLPEVKDRDPDLVYAEEMRERRRA